MRTRPYTPAAAGSLHNGHGSCRPSACPTSASALERQRKGLWRPAGEEPEDFQGMKQESWLHAHMRCKAGHLSGSLRGGEERVSVIRSRLLSLEIARAAQRRPTTGDATSYVPKRKRVRLVSAYLGPRWEFEAHLGCFGITKYSFVHVLSPYSPILSIKNHLVSLSNC